LLVVRCNIGVALGPRVQVPPTGSNYVIDGGLIKTM